MGEKEEPCFVDVVVFGEGGEVVYRGQGDHPFAVGVGGVTSVCPTCMAPAAARREVCITNSCGAFICAFNKQGREGLLIKNESFGGHSLMYHLAGVMQIHGPKVHFKGVKGCQGLERLSKAIGLPTAESKVFMCMYAMHLGKRVQTTHRGYLENRIHAAIPGVQVLGRVYDENLQVRLRLELRERRVWPGGCLRALGPDLGFPTAGAVPLTADVRVAHHGGVQFRLAWKDCPWTAEVEAASLRLCEWLGRGISSCC